MANKRSLDPPLDQSPSSLNQAKKVKFGSLPTHSASSKTRNNSSSTFEPIDDATDLQFDELNQVGKIKKGNVKVDGYDSDSSTENTEVRSSKKKKKQSKDEMDEDDIFGDEKEGDDDVGRKDKPKFEKIDVGLKVKKGAEAKDYLDLGDIEGQEFGREEEEEEEDEEYGEGVGEKKNRARNQQQEEDDSANDYSEEEEDFVPGDEFANADDAPRARRKSKKGMGFLLSKFNMAEELQEGRMAADGSYVASAKDPEAVHDNWLEGVNSKKTIKQARDAKRLRDGKFCHHFFFLYSFAVELIDLFFFFNRTTAK
jgi:CD2 antigen cytoplasmic tail-binding protein 2